MFKKSFHHLVLAVLLCASGLAFDAHAASAKPNYALRETFHLPGATHWDLMAYDSKNHRLFVTRGDSLDIFDTATKKIIGSIPTAGAHGVALASELGKGFVSNGKANTVTIFDLATLKGIATVPTGTKPDALAYDDFTQRVFVANADSSDMTVINAKDGTVVETIKLMGQPEYAVVDGKGKLFVNLEDKSQIVVLDTKDLKIVSRYDLAPNCDGPRGLAIDAARNRLVSVCANKNMLIVDAGNGKIIDTLPIGQHSDAATFDAAKNLAFSSNGDGTLSVVGLAEDGHYKVLETVETKPTARTMALDPLSHTIYLVAAETEGFDPSTEQHPEPRPHIKPHTFMVLIVTDVY
jgi:YVTN family beta-propeller protein